MLIIAAATRAIRIVVFLVSNLLNIVLIVVWADRSIGLVLIL